MKILIVLVVFVGVIDFSESIPEELRMQLFRQMVENCGQQEGASEEDVAAIIAFKPPNTHASKCVQACLSEAGKIIKDNKLDLQAVDIVAEIVFEEDTQKIDQVHDVAKECVNVTDDDRCEAVAKIMECAARVGEEKGYTAGFL